MCECAFRLGPSCLTIVWANLQRSQNQYALALKDDGASTTTPTTTTVIVKVNYNTCTLHSTRVRVRVRVHAFLHSYKIVSTFESYFKVERTYVPKMPLAALPSAERPQLLSVRVRMRVCAFCCCLSCLCVCVKAHDAWPYASHDRATHHLHIPELLFAKCGRVQLHACMHVPRVIQSLELRLKKFDPMLASLGY